MNLVNYNTRTREHTANFNSVINSLLSDVEVKNTLKSKVPLVNISESTNSFRIDVAAPGRQREDFQIRLKKDVLTVSTEEVEDRENLETTFSRKEFNINGFSRSFNLPENADKENIEATYLNGVLSLTIAKQDEKLLQKEIKVS